MRSIPTAVLAVILVLSVRPAAAGAQSPMPNAEPACRPTLDPGHHELTLDVDGTARQVIIHVPAAEPGTRPPAVVAFHGFSAFAYQLEATSGLSDLADERGFVAAYPQGLGVPPRWEIGADPRADDRDLRFTEAVMDALVEEACVDPARIVMAGHSMGGAMASDVACHVTDRVAGVALVAALWVQPPCQPARPVPVVAMHAIDDPVLPYEGGQLPNLLAPDITVLAAEDAIGTWAAHDGCGGERETTESADGAGVLSWSGCLAPVVLHRLPSGGHAWPDVGSGLIVDLIASTAAG